MRTRVIAAAFGAILSLAAVASTMPAATASPSAKSHQLIGNTSARHTNGTTRADPDADASQVFGGYSVQPASGGKMSAKYMITWGQHPSCAGLISGTVIQWGLTWAPGGEYMDSWRYTWFEVCDGAGNATIYGPFIAYYPGHGWPIHRPLNLPLNDGDQVLMTLAQHGQTVVATAKDVTTGATAATKFPKSSLGGEVGFGVIATDDDGNILDPQNFGDVQIQKASLNGVPIGKLGAVPVTLVDANGNPLVVPQPLAKNQSTFDITYVG